LQMEDAVGDDQINRYGCFQPSPRLQLHVLHSAALFKHVEKAFDLPERPKPVSKMTQSADTEAAGVHKVFAGFFSKRRLRRE
jgi:hypothetical protein